MSSSKSRKTEIVAHISKKRLQEIFPDVTVDKKIKIHHTFVDTYGDEMEQVHSWYSYNQKDQLLVEALKAAGIEYEIFEVERKYDGYVRIEGECYMIRAQSPLKTAVIFSSELDEVEHYEKVDEIVKHLAEKDVAVLRGECEITITTRC